MNEPKSKSQIKREAKALQELGANLALLSSSQLDKIPLPDQLKEAIIQCKTIKSHIAKKRYIQFIGGLFRQLEDATPIQVAYDKIVNGAALDSARFHLMETWRSRLMSDDKGALTEFIKQYPSEDAQQLRQLIRKSKSERDQQKNLGASKALFRMIRELIV